MPWIVTGTSTKPLPGPPMGVAVTSTSTMPLASSTVASCTARENGAGSSSWIVTTVADGASAPWVGAPNVTRNCSSGSNAVSSTIGTSIEPDVAPGAIVIVAGTGPRSSPDVVIGTTLTGMSTN